MTFNGTLQLLLYMVILIALAKPLGGYMARVYAGQPLVLDQVLGPLEDGKALAIAKQRVDRNFDRHARTA